MIKVVGLKKRYGGKEVLKGIDLEIERGEVFSLIGPNGAGKTTLLRLIDLLEKPTLGKIYFSGLEANSSERARLEFRRRTAMVFHKPVMFNASVYDNVVYGLKVRGMDKGNLQPKAKRIMEMVGLADYEKRNARTLSAGEGQRVALARAIVTEPEVLLLDEPTANLDPISGIQIEDLIGRIIGELKTTVIMATHDRSQAQRLAHRIGVLMEGEILQIGDSHRIFTAPSCKRVADFLGVENILKGKVVGVKGEKALVDIGDKVIEASSGFGVGKEVYACLRTEDISLSLLPIPKENSFRGKIIRQIFLGPLTRVEMDCGFKLVALVPTNLAQELELNDKEDIYLFFKASRVHLIPSDDIV